MDINTIAQMMQEVQEEKEKLCQEYDLRFGEMAILITKNGLSPTAARRAARAAYQPVMDRTNDLDKFYMMLSDFMVKYNTQPQQPPAAAEGGE